MVSRHEIGTPTQRSSEAGLVGAFTVIVTTDGSFAALEATNTTVDQT